MSERDRRVRPRLCFLRETNRNEPRPNIQKKRGIHARSRLQRLCFFDFLFLFIFIFFKYRILKIKRRAFSSKHDRDQSKRETHRRRRRRRASVTATVWKYRACATRDISTSHCSDSNARCLFARRPGRRRSEKRPPTQRRDATNRHRRDQTRAPCVARSPTTVNSDTRLGCARQPPPSALPLHPRRRQQSLPSSPYRRVQALRPASSAVVCLLFAATRARIL